MQVKFLIPTAVMLLFLSACKKDKTETPLVYPDYAALKVGNYWVYERYDIDANGVATASGVTDSCYIEKDTTIGGKIYFKRVCPTFPPNLSYNPYLRDSLHYLVNSAGDILFSSQNFADTFKRYVILTPPDTAAVVIEKMGDRDLAVNTPAGNFKSSAMIKTYNMRSPWFAAGPTRRTNIRYSENIGVITEDLPFFLSNPGYTQRRLVRYKVQ